MPAIRASALLVASLWLAVPVAAQEPAEPPPEPSPTPRVLLPLKDRQGPTVVLQRSRARLYQASSATAWEALQVLVRDLGLVASRDKKGQVWTRYAFEPIALWLFGRLAERLGEDGSQGPFDWSSLSERPGGPDANQPCPSSRVARETKARMQEPRPLSKPQPLFPSKDLARGGVSKVEVAAVLGVDGAIQHVSVGDAPLDGRLAAAAAAAVGLWRYEPARLLGCPVPTTMNVTVSFVRH